MKLVGELPRRSVAERGVRPNLIVVVPPIDGCAPCFEDRHETVRVEELIADLAVEGLDLRILGRFAGIDEVQLDRPLGAPAQQGMARELRAMIHTKRGAAPMTNGGVSHSSPLEATTYGNVPRCPLGPAWLAIDVAKKQHQALLEDGSGVRRRLTEMRTVLARVEAPQGRSGNRLPKLQEAHGGTNLGSAPARRKRRVQSVE